MILINKLLVQWKGLFSYQQHARQTVQRPYRGRSSTSTQRSCPIKIITFRWALTVYLLTMSSLSMKKRTLSSGTRPFCSTKRCQEERRRTGFGYAPVRRVDRQNLHALSVASITSKFVIWAPSGIGKASRTWVGNERAWLMWVGFSFFVKRCTGSISFSGDTRVSVKRES